MAKADKASVDYEPRASHPDHCAVCRHFEPPNSCARVLGVIAPEAWCKLFRRRHPFYDRSP